MWWAGSIGGMSTIRAWRTGRGIIPTRAPRCLQTHAHPRGDWFSWAWPSSRWWVHLLARCGARCRDIACHTLWRGTERPWRNRDRWWREAQHARSSPIVRLLHLLPSSPEAVTGEVDAEGSRRHFSAPRAGNRHLDGDTGRLCRANSSRRVEFDHTSGRPKRVGAEEASHGLTRPRRRGRSPWHSQPRGAVVMLSTRIVVAALRRQAAMSCPSWLTATTTSAAWLVSSASVIWRSASLGTSYQT